MLNYFYISTQRLRKILLLLILKFSYQNLLIVGFLFNRHGNFMRATITQSWWMKTWTQMTMNQKQWRKLQRLLLCAYNHHLPRDLQCLKLLFYSKRRTHLSLGHSLGQSSSIPIRGHKETLQPPLLRLVRPMLLPPSPEFLVAKLRIVLGEKS